MALTAALTGFLALAMVDATDDHADCSSAVYRPRRTGTAPDLIGHRLPPP